MNHKCLANKIFRLGNFFVESLVLGGRLRGPEAGRTATLPPMSSGATASVCGRCVPDNATYVMRSPAWIFLPIQVSRNRLAPNMYSRGQYRFRYDHSLTWDTVCGVNLVRVRFDCLIQSIHWWCIFHMDQPRLRKIFQQDGIVPFPPPPQWPAKSPDLSVIENVQGLIKNRLEKWNFNSIEEVAAIVVCTAKMLRIPLEQNSQALFLFLLS